MVTRDFALYVVKFKQLDRTDHHGHIVDISRSGVGVESKTPMEPGLVWFRDRIWGQHSGVLLWSKQVGTRFRSGIRFASLPCDAEAFVNNQGASTIIREPLKDLEKIIKLMVESLKGDIDLGKEMIEPRGENSAKKERQNNSH